MKSFMMRAIVNPMVVFSESLGAFAFWAVMFTLLSLILSYLFGQTYACQVIGASAGGCYDLGGWVFVYLALKILLSGVFIALWYRVACLKKEPDAEFLRALPKESIKDALILCGFIFINFIPAISLALLVGRVPNPDWRIEILYFTVVAAGFLAPFILMRLYGVIADLIAGNGWRNMREAWLNGNGRNIQIIIATSVVFIICMIVFLGLSNIISGVDFTSVSVLYFFKELLFDFMVYFVTAMAVCLFDTMRLLLSGEISDEKNRRNI